MPKYDVHALCPECGQFHVVLISAEVSTSFEVYTVSDALNDGILSPDVISPISVVICPNTKKRLPVPPSDRLVLVKTQAQSNP
jgi:hypothetical protein